MADTIRGTGQKTGPSSCHGPRPKDRTTAMIRYGQKPPHPPVSRRKDLGRFAHSMTCPCRAVPCRAAKGLERVFHI